MKLLRLDQLFSEQAVGLAHRPAVGFWKIAKITNTEGIDRYDMTTVADLELRACPRGELLKEICRTINDDLEEMNLELDADAYQSRVASEGGLEWTMGADDADEFRQPVFMSPYMNFGSETTTAYFLITPFGETHKIFSMRNLADCVSEQVEMQVRQALKKRYPEVLPREKGFGF